MRTLWVIKHMYTSWTYFYVNRQANEGCNVNSYLINFYFRQRSSDTSRDREMYEVSTYAQAFI